MKHLEPLFGALKHFNWKIFSVLWNCVLRSSRRNHIFLELDIHLRNLEYYSFSHCCQQHKKDRCCPTSFKRALCTSFKSLQTSAHKTFHNRASSYSLLKVSIEIMIIWKWISFPAYNKSAADFVTTKINATAATFL